MIYYTQQLCIQFMHVYTILPQIITQAFVPFQQLFTTVTKWDRRLCETSVYYLKLWIKPCQAMNSNGCWQCSCSRSARYYNGQRSSYSWCLYICVVASTAGQLILEKEPTGQSTQWICSGSDKEFSDGGSHSVRKLFTDHMEFYYTKGVLLYLPIILGEGRKEKA